MHSVSLLYSLANCIINSNPYKKKGKIYNLFVLFLYISFLSMITKLVNSDGYYATYKCTVIQISKKT